MNNAERNSTLNRTWSKDTTTGRLFVVSGPSGSGKSTLCRTVCDTTGAHLSVSATTRAPGREEVNGKDYFFLEEQEFLRKIEAGEFLEYARVFGHYYGTPVGAVRDLLSQGKDVVLEIDIQGAEQVFEKFPQAVGILILPPNMEVLRERLCHRGRDAEETISRRLGEAQREIDQARSGGHYPHTIINDGLDKSISALIQLIEAKH